jgi:hypothetical protein
MMIPRRLLGVIVGCVLYPHLALAGDAPRSAADGTPGLFDPGQWTVVKSATANFGKSLSGAHVVLLKSVAATGSDGVDRPLYSVNVLVARNARILYAFAALEVPPLDRRRTDRVFYMDDVLDLRDVTGDRVPEIIFHSGWRAASDWETVIHVVEFTNRSTTPFRDIRLDSFAESLWWKFRWLTVKGRTFAVVAEPVEPTAGKEAGCHTCPNLHKYLVYDWQRQQGRFVLRKTIPSTGELHTGDVDPFEKDRSYIIGNLNKLRR